MKFVKCNYKLDEPRSELRHRNNERQVFKLGVVFGLNRGCCVSLMVPKEFIKPFRRPSAQEDVLFRLKNNPFYNWRKLLYMVAQRFKALSQEKRCEYYKETTTCLILDDTIQPKKGKRLEAIGKVFDHVLHRYLLGMKGLFLCYWDEISTIPLDFSFYNEKGKNQKRPYGFSKRELQARYSKARPGESCGYKRFLELKKSKIESGLVMIKRSLRFGFIPQYVLTDGWFSTKEFIWKI